MNIIEKNNMVKFAPIVLFTYNRPDHTRKTLEALAVNEYADESELLIYSDGPKNQDAIDKVQAVRSLIKNVQGFKSVKIIERDKNWGLANSVIDAVTNIVNKYGRIIVLEDDILTSPYFLRYMNDGLNIYENEEKVISIHAYQYPISPKGLPATFFLKGADCQGWATWASRWSIFENDANKLLNYIIDNNLQYEFDINGSYPYTQMLKSQIEKKVDSWAIRWYASAFINNKYTLYPNKSIIYNIGFDNSGIHCDEVDNFNNKTWNHKKPIIIEKVSNIETNELALKKWLKYYNKNILTRLIKKIFYKKVQYNPFIPFKKIIIFKMKKIIKLFIPPIILKLFLLIKKKSKGNEQFKETKLSWDDILLKTANGYDKDQILQKCKTSLLKVKNGEYPYERDSVLFNEIEIFFPLLSSLFYVSLNNNNKLNIIDFGGSLGSTYFQNKDILKQTGITINWNIIEQDSFVKCGNEYFSNEELHFYNNIDEVLKQTDISVCLLSSVLPYLKEPYTILETIKQNNIKYIIIDRTMFLNNKTNDILTIQNVPPEIYEASYPAWFLSLNKFYNYFSKNYKIIYKWFCDGIFKLNNHQTSIRGFFLKGE
jgi:putative methyltransferase (TIGR04325 family)